MSIDDIKESQSAFEQWVRSRPSTGLDLARVGREYASGATNVSWLAWQAARYWDAPQENEQEVRDFEACARAHDWDVRRDEKGFYISPDAMRLWIGWAWRAALAAVPKP